MEAYVSEDLESYLLYYLHVAFPGPYPFICVKERPLYYTLNNQLMEIFGSLLPFRNWQSSTWTQMGFNYFLNLFSNQLYSVDKGEMKIRYIRFFSPSLELIFRFLPRRCGAKFQWELDDHIKYFELCIPFILILWLGNKQHNTEIVNIWKKQRGSIGTWEAN